MAKFIFLVLVVLVLIFPKDAYAVTNTINNPPSSVSSTEFTISVTISGASEGKNYLRIDLYKEGTNNYFGETYNGSSWVRDTQGIQYFPIDIVSVTDWTGDIKGRIGSPSSSEYDGQGTYKLRVKRYTSSGAQGVEDANASAVTVVINAPTATPSNTPTPTPTNSPTNTPTPTPTPTKTPTPTVGTTGTPVPTPTPKKGTPTPTHQVMTAQNTNTTQQVQGAQVKPSGDPVNLGGQLDSLEAPKQSYNWWKLLIIMGTVIVTAACSLFMYNNYLKDKKTEETV